MGRDSPSAQENLGGLVVKKLKTTLKQFRTTWRPFYFRVTLKQSRTTLRQLRTTLKQLMIYNTETVCEDILTVYIPFSPKSL